MMRNLKAWFDRVTGKTARLEEAALRGETTSGHLRQGQRDRLFREAKERRRANRRAGRRERS